MPLGNMLHELGQILAIFYCLEEKMYMISHQNEAVNPAWILLFSCFNSLYEGSVVIIAIEKRLMIVASVDYVVRSISNYLPGISSHGKLITNLIFDFKKNLNPSPIL